MPLLLLLTVGLAEAACAYSQSTFADHVDVTLTAGPGVIHCRTITLTADVPLTIEAKIEGAEYGPRPIRPEQQRLLPGGAWEIAVPNLDTGDRLRLTVSPPVDGLTVSLAPAGRAIDPAPIGGRMDQSWTFETDEAHPGWAFADPTRGRLVVRRTWRLGPNAPSQLLGHPDGASVPTAVARSAGAGALEEVPGGWRWSGGAGEVDLAWSVPGLPPQGMVQLPPGSLTIHAPGMGLRTAGDPGVQIRPTDDGVQVWTAEGGTFRWRVLDAGGGEAPVIPERVTYLAGLQWRFNRLSLPEPAVPLQYRALAPGDALLEALLGETQRLLDGAIPGQDALHPRLLNRAWHSGWATPIERGLILARLLEQAKYSVDLIYTGDSPDFETLTGFDHLLLRVPTDNGETWLDPSCAVCTIGEISPLWVGKPAIGAAERIPTPKGRLVRRIRLAGTTYAVRFEADGAAALWLRSLAKDLDPPQLARRLGEALGVADAQLVGVSVDLAPDPEGLPAPWEGVVTVLESATPGTSIVELRTTRAPGPPLGDGPTPWAGGWSDEI